MLHGQKDPRFDSNFKQDYSPDCSYQIPQIWLVQGHPSNFKDTRLKKIVDFDQNWALPDCNSSLNSPMALKWCTKFDVVIEMVPYCFPRSSIKFQGNTGQKIANYFYLNWAFPDCNFSLNSPMDLKSCTKLDVLYKRCPIIFQGHPSNFKVTRAEKLMIWIKFEQDYLAGRSYQIHQICLVF